MKGTRGRWTCILAVLMLYVFLTFGGGAQAQEGGVFNSGGANANEGPFEYEFEGVKVVFQEIKQSPPYPNYFHVAFVATSDKDMLFKISPQGGIAYDNRGMEFTIDSHTWIGYFEAELRERQIIGGVPTRFGFYFHRKGLELADIFPRIDLNIMGKVVTMRNVPSTK